MQYSKLYFVVRTKWLQQQFKIKQRNNRNIKIKMVEADNKHLARYYMSPFSKEFHPLGLLRFSISKIISKQQQQQKITKQTL